MAKSVNKLGAEIKKLQRFLEKDATRIIQKEGSNHFKKSFQNQGFTDAALEKWKPRKTVNKKGKDIKRYKTNRVGRKGNLTAFGRRNSRRAILTGHNTGGDKLRNSITSRREKDRVVWTTYKPYASLHNDGSKHLPKRQFIGKSKVLNDKIKAEFKRTLAQKYGFKK